MYIFHNAIISNILLLSVLLLSGVVEQVITAHNRIVRKDSLPARENKHKSTYPKINHSYDFHKDDDVLSITTEDYHERIRTNDRNNHFVDKTRRFRPRTTRRARSFADLIEFTTQFSQKLSLPIHESSFNRFHKRLNNSLDLEADNSYNQLPSINFNKLLPPKKEYLNNRKNYSHSYEVHEEIQEDSNVTSPVPLYNNTKLANIYYNHKYT